MESIWHSGFTSSSQNWLVFHRFGIPHHEFRFLSLIVMNEAHQIPVVFIDEWIRIVFSVVENLTSSFGLSEVNSAQNLLIFQVIFDTSFEVNIIFADSILRKLRLEKGKICVLSLATYQILIDDWEFHRNVINQNIPRCLTSSQVENKFAQFWCLLTGQEWMLFLEVDIDPCLGATKKSDDLVSILVDVFPSIHEVEHVMVWKFKPLYLIWVETVSLHDTISCWFFLIKVENEFAFFDHQIWSHLHG